MSSKILHVYPMHRHQPSFFITTNTRVRHLTLNARGWTSVGSRHVAGLANSSLISKSKKVARDARLYSTGNEELRKTDLYDFHLEYGAKMVPYGGYLMPLSYEGRTHAEEHLHVRKHAGLFDVGHMVQMRIHGPTATQFLQHITPSSLTALPLHSIPTSLRDTTPIPIYSSTLSVMLNEEGGIIDDLVITRWGEDEYYLVTNAARRERDLGWIRERMAQWNKGPGGLLVGDRAENRDVKLELFDGWGLIAIQGPASSSVLQNHTWFHLNQTLLFGKSAHMKIKIGEEFVKLHVARGGYTGEDGFEIQTPPEWTVPLARLLRKNPIKVAGLAVRDSLRIEAGLCLYGHELDEETSPNEAGLTWVIGKNRRANPLPSSPPPFIGFPRVREELTNGPPRKRIGLVLDAGAPARDGAKIYASQDSTEAIGKVTSGIPSPTIKHNIAMGYIQTTATSPTDEENQLWKKGNTVYVEVRGKRRPTEVVALPFIRHKYFKGIFATMTKIQIAEEQERDEVGYLRKAFKERAFKLYDKDV